MKILLITSKPPFPKVDGGTIASAALVNELLIANFEVQLFTLSTHKHPFIEDEFPNHPNLKVSQALIDTRIKPIQGIFNTLMGKSYHLNRFHNNDAAEKLIQIAKKLKPNVVIYDSLFSTVYYDDLFSNISTKHIYREHNIEHIIWQNLAYEASGWKKSAYLALSETLRKAEIKVFRKFKNVWAINTQDLGLMKNLGFKGKAVLHYPSFDFSDQPPNLNFDNLKFYQLASMDWKPNLEGVIWFVHNVYNKFKKDFSNFEIHLAGKGMPESLIKKSKANLQISGSVVNAHEFVADKQILIVPLFSGSGIRIKIPEAMAQGKFVIATSKGAEGLNLKHGEQIWIADSAEQWKEAFKFVTENTEEVNRIRKNGFLWAKQNFSTHSLSVSLTTIIKDSI